MTRVDFEFALRPASSRIAFVNEEVSGLPHCCQDGYPSSVAFLSIDLVQVERRLRDVLVTLGPGVRHDLLRVLTSPSNVRADVIRQFYERPSRQGWAELLIDLEEDDFARAALVAILEELLGQAPARP